MCAAGRRAWRPPSQSLRPSCNQDVLEGYPGENGAGGSTDQPSGGGTSTWMKSSGGVEPLLGTSLSSTADGDVAHLVSSTQEQKDDDLLPSLHLAEQRNRDFTKHQESQDPLPLKWDQSAGRVGDPPGLGQAPGSSQQQEVKLSSNEATDDHLFPPMQPDVLQWLESSKLDQEWTRAVEDKEEQRGEQGQQDGHHQLQDYRLQLQDQDEEKQPQSLKWDLPAGRAGNPPGLMRLIIC